MKILYIWDGTKDDLNERESNIASTLDMYPDIEILMITRNKDFKCSQKLKDRFTYLDMTELLKNTKCNSNHHYSTSDHLRWWYCSENEDILYLDTDTTALRPIPDDMEFGISRFDECSIYNGKRTDECKRFYAKYKHRHHFYDNSVAEYGWKLPDFITDLTPYFKHHGKSGKITERYFIDINRGKK